MGDRGRAPDPTFITDSQRTQRSAENKDLLRFGHGSMSNPGCLVTFSEIFFYLVKLTGPF